MGRDGAEVTSSGKLFQISTTDRQTEGRNVELVKRYGVIAVIIKEFFI